MTAIQRLIREYNLISALVVAGLGMALALGWVELDEAQMAAVLGFIAALLLVLRFLVTPVASPVLPVGSTVYDPATKQPVNVVARKP